jgi:RNA polymerase subunit RPABC4/transcription elongation factor Spt4
MHSIPYRSNPRKPSAFMNREQVYAAHRLYRRIGSVPRIAEMIYQRFGYKNKKTCSLALYRAFASYRLPTVNARGCARCGCAMDERTWGCPSCNKRHGFRSRKVPGRPRIMSPRTCRSCGIGHDEKTPGCEVCRSRHSLRKWRERQR